MKTYNVLYSNYAELNKYIKDKNISIKDEILVQVFCGIYDKNYIKKIIEDILKILPSAKIIGSTTENEIYYGRTLQNECVLAISIFKNTKVKTYAQGKNDYSNYIDSRILAQKLVNDKTKVLISFVGGKWVDGEEVLEGINSVTKDIIVAGGLAGSKDLNSSGYVFTENKILDKGIVAASLSSDKLYVHTDSSFNWVPIGKEYTITKAKGNIIKTIKDIPAEEFYRKYIGYNIQDIIEIGVQFPIMVKRNERYIAKPIINFTDNKEIQLSTKIKEGEKIRLGYGNLAEILNGTRKIHHNIVTKPIESVFVYSCGARKSLLKSMVNYETKPLNKDISVSGFYTHGQFNHIDGINMFYSQAMIILGLSENINARINIDNKTEKKCMKSRKKEELILYNLIKTTGDELNYLTKELEKKVEEKTLEIKNNYYLDQLTGLFNRNKLLKDIESSNVNKIALIDIKSFTDINDFYGNSIGDIVLNQFGKFTNQFSKINNFIPYRIGSDVFAVLAKVEIDNELFIDQMRKFQKSIRGYCFTIKEYDLSLDATISIVLNEDKLLEKADINLNYAKKADILFQVYNNELGLIEKIEKNLLWVDKIRKAIITDKIIPYFQPIINNRTNKIEKYEALMRMIDEKGNIITPFMFLDIAKKAGLYNELTKIMINKTFKVFMNNDYEFSLNLLVSDIKNQDIRKLIIEKLENKKIASRVVFEIVESEGIEKFDEIIEFINEVKQYGAKVAIDDFGTGYSNFAYLMKLNVDYIKIDGSIIRNIYEDKMSEMVAESIVNFSSKLGINTIAEFVHNQSVHNKINELGINFSQGYYFSKPEPNVIVQNT